VIIAVVLLNQIFGPIGCKYALKRAGEAGKGSNDDEDGKKEETKEGRNEEGK
jgi:hypothetical protein